MESEGKGKSWRGISEEIIVGMTEWRQQNPKATFRAIEEELDLRLAELRVRMLTDLAIASASAEWERGTEAPVCPKCGAALQPNGKKKRKLQTRGGREVELEREYGVCPKCGQGIFPPG
jgi:ribosomal protein S27AE